MDIDLCAGDETTQPPIDFVRQPCKRVYRSGSHVLGSDASERTIVELDIETAAKDGENLTANAGCESGARTAPKPLNVETVSLKHHRRKYGSPSRPVAPALPLSGGQ